MDNKKIIYLSVIIIVILLIIGGLGWFIFYQFSKATAPTPPPPAMDNTYNGSLPQAGSGNSDGSLSQADQQSLAKEKKFISSFYKATDFKTKPEVKSYELPITDIKETVSNYRDFSRKLAIDNALPKLSANGFAIIDNTINPKIIDWENGYQALNQKNLPIFITADSILGVYLDTMQLTYKEIERDSFYPSLWQLLKQLQAQARQRYETGRQQFGILNNTVTDANRLELAYLSVALELMKPDASQIKDALNVDNKFFTPTEGDTYVVQVPEYLKPEVEQEIKLIKTKSKPVKSPILLYTKNYSQYEIPAEYTTSEKLKNYYLTISWLNDALFPLWNTSNDCGDCLLDAEDQKISFVAASYISSDIANDQTLKNRWANIYKTISFFKGLEANLTYLDYNRALEKTFEVNYHLFNIFGTDDGTVKERIALLQKELAANKYSPILSGDTEDKNKVGLRLLRNNYLLENKLFKQLTGDAAGLYLGETKNVSLPYTTCLISADVFERCYPTALDIFNLLGNETAKQILAETKNSDYANYENQLNNFTSEMNKFDDATWHDNNYLSLLSALRSLTNGKTAGYPSFMRTPEWQIKSLSTSLGAWTYFHRPVNVEKESQPDATGLVAIFPYGYIEPQPLAYGQLLSNVNMVLDGFNALQIIDNTQKPYERLKNLALVLERVYNITNAELANQDLTGDDYSFINNFNKQIASVTGDIKTGNLTNHYQFVYSNDNKNKTTETINGFNYLIAVYPSSDGKLFFAIGPTLNYDEKGTKSFSDWQTSIKP